ncbi:protein FANTASTIC FOUR 3-like [Solanum pennellii]|uniref:Protein FANTASTIC FOUR 3-like n=1 Tax=Solanum pennellii TaxID=28526 RepID=A0ABM1H0C4_SOLPN|nr:protein FANTASTIC FOUR 3-like [Solanum pennellii]
MGVAINKVAEESGGWWSLILCNPKREDYGEKQVTKLSIKSLEMCTESLGSETGRESSESIEDINNSKIVKKRTSTSSNKILVAHFPPPLTSIIQVTPHRQGDRLILKATTISAPKACFKAERLHGRLRLSFNNTEILARNGYITPTKCNQNGTNIPTFWVAIS